MGNEIKRPKEGMTTISVAFTRNAIEKVTGAVKSLHARGWSRADVVQRMKNELSGLSRRTLERLYDLALDDPVKDDFAPDEIVSQKAIGKDTFELELKAPRTDLSMGDVVRFLGSEWYVKRVPGAKLQIRRIV